MPSLVECHEQRLARECHELEGPASESRLISLPTPCPLNFAFSWRMSGDSSRRHASGPGSLLFSRLGVPGSLLMGYT